MNKIVKQTLLGFILLLIAVIMIISILLISKLSCNSSVEDNKDLIMANYVLLFVILISYVGYLLAIGDFTKNFDIVKIILIFLILIGFILVLVYLIERNNKDVVSKSFVIGSLYYTNILIFVMVLY